MGSTPTDASANGSVAEICRNQNRKSTCTQNKAMVPICWDFQGIIYFELLLPNIIVDSDLFCKQLQNLKITLQAKRSERHKVRLLHDNAKPHTAKVTQQELEESNLEILPHPPYSLVGMRSYCYLIVIVINNNNFFLLLMSLWASIWSATRKNLSNSIYSFCRAEFALSNEILFEKWKNIV